MGIWPQRGGKVYQSGKTDRVGHFIDLVMGKPSSQLGKEPSASLYAGYIPHLCSVYKPSKLNSSLAQTLEESYLNRCLEP